MCFRIFYSISQGWRHRQQLKRYMQDPALQVTQVQDIYITDLQARGVKALVLDFDGVLAAHGEMTLSPEIVTFLKSLREFPTYILSNKPTIERQEYFQLNFPAIKFIIANRKKPYPDGLQHILRLTNLEPRQILLVDDRLGTGILATIIAGTQGLYVSQPYVNFKSRPVVESFFAFLRWLEKKLIYILA